MFERPAVWATQPCVRSAQHWYVRRHGSAPTWACLGAFGWLGWLAGCEAGAHGAQRAGAALSLLLVRRGLGARLGGAGPVRVRLLRRSMRRHCGALAGSIARSIAHGSLQTGDCRRAGGAAGGDSHTGQLEAVRARVCAGRPRDF